MPIFTPDMQRRDNPREFRLFKIRIPGTVSSLLYLYPLFQVPLSGLSETAFLYDIVRGSRRGRRSIYTRNRKILYGKTG